MSLSEIYTLFADCKNWEERYRLLIQFSRRLPVPSEQERESWLEIEGCESRLWFRFHVVEGKLEAYSEARLMQGILWIVALALKEKPAAERGCFEWQSLFDELHITAHLTGTRLAGLKKLEQAVRLACSECHFN